MATAEEATAAIVAPWRKHRNGVRHGILGDSGTGKTVHMRWLLRVLLAEGVAEAALVLDDKEREPQFAGETRVNLADADARPPAGEVIVFRGDVRNDVWCTPEELAARVVQFARGEPPLRSVLFLDEIKRATSASEDGDGKKWTSPAARLICTEGRSMQASIVWGNQSPQELPRSAVDNASTIAIHRMGPVAANYLGERWLLEREMVEAIRTLELGQFVLYVPGQTFWDRRIYAVPRDAAG